MENQTAEAGPGGKVFVFDFFQGTHLFITQDSVKL